MIAFESIDKIRKWIADNTDKDGICQIEARVLYDLLAALEEAANELVKLEDQEEHPGH